MRAIGLVLLAACSSSTSDKGGVAVELASVTLADDCGDYGWMPPPSKPPPEAKEPAAKRAASQPVAAAEAYCPPGQNCAGAYRRSCSQTSMQISFSADRAAKVMIKKVELLDGMGKYIQDLAPRKPSRWDGSAYVAWDEQLETSKPISASYALAAPNWEKLGGRMQSQAKKYNLHVVVAVDGSEHSLDKESVQPVVMQPDVVTLR